MKLSGDAQRFLVRNYRSYGPIYRVRAAHQRFTVMAGQAANQFLRDRGEDYFSSEDTMGGLDREFGMRVHVLRGKEHRDWRWMLRTGMSRELLNERWDGLIGHTENHVRGWRPGSVIPVVDQFQRLAAAQLSYVLTGTSTVEVFPTLRSAFELVLGATVTGKYPAAVLRLPTYRRRRAALVAFTHRELAHRAAAPRPGAADLLDKALTATDGTGRACPPHVRAGIALQGYFAGINTVAYLYSFMLYALLRDPELKARVTDEVDSVWAGGPTFDTVRTMTTLHGLTMEALRLYPVAPGSTRTARKPFAFHGFRVDQGTRVLIATAVPHHLAEHYPMPGTFDVDRDFPSARRSGVYAPFSVGDHSCLGAGLTEILAVATMACLMRTVRLRLPTPDYQLRIRATPGPNPGKRFTARVLTAERT